MRREMLKLLAWAALGSFLVAGCSTKPAHQPVAVMPSGEIVVSEAPPAPRHEATGPSPGPTYVWLAGYWAWMDNRWVWIPGHWQAPPRTGVVWVPGRWNHTAQGWVWTPGRWE
jgi:hypothetical protein